MKFSGPILIIIVVLVLTSCGNKIPHEEVNPLEKARLVENFDAYKNSVPVNFSAVNLDGDKLELIFNYSGGCEKHEFALLGLTAVAKSLPPSRRIMLYHNNNDDSCRELITDTLYYDITALGNDAGKEINLNLEGWTEPINYTQSK